MHKEDIARDEGGGQVMREGTARAHAGFLASESAASDQRDAPKRRTIRGAGADIPDSARKGAATTAETSMTMMAFMRHPTAVRAPRRATAMAAAAHGRVGLHRAGIVRDRCR